MPPNIDILHVFHHFMFYRDFTDPVAEPPCGLAGPAYILETPLLAGRCLLLRTEGRSYWSVSKPHTTPMLGKAIGQVGSPLQRASIQARKGNPWVPTSNLTEQATLAPAAAFKLVINEQKFIEHLLSVEGPEKKGDI